MPEVAGISRTVPAGALSHKYLDGVQRMEPPEVGACAQSEYWRTKAGATVPTSRRKAARRWRIIFLERHTGNL
jgi:hypothetical protein